MLTLTALAALGFFYIDAAATRHSQQRMQDFHLPVMALIVKLEENLEDTARLVTGSGDVQAGKAAGLLYAIESDLAELHELHHTAGDHQADPVSHRIDRLFVRFSAAVRSGDDDSELGTLLDVLRLNIRQHGRLHGIEVNAEMARFTESSERRLQLLSLLILAIGLVSAMLVWRIVDMIKKTLRAHVEMEHELRETEQRVQQMQRVEALGQLVGGVAHDFNNLLTAIQGNTELLLDELPEKHLFEAKEIEKSADRAASLTRRLMAFARRQPMDFQSVELNQLVRGMELMLRRLISEQIELVVSLSDDAAVVHADPAQLEQVIMNLVLNARDAMPEGGKLTVSITAAADERWAITVADTGMGMDSAVQDKMFEPFFTTKGRRRGTGLGLSSSHGIVRKSGGEFRVQSAPGKGTTITVLLPAEKPTSHPVVPEPRPQLAGGDETILLVEDEQQIRRLTASALGRLGYQVISAPDGHEALRICREYPQRIHLILSDVIMPGLNGRELVDAALRFRPSTRVIFMSGYTEDVVLKSGVTGIDYPLVQKPFVIADLAALIRETLTEPLPLANAR